MSRLTIALDIMGGDHGPPVILSAAKQAIQTLPDVQFILCGREEIISPALEDLTDDQRQRVVVQHCEQSVEMGEAPTSALRNKKQSSMRKMLELVEA
ncbi:MAG: phosphate acyltransferase, partial [Pseudomonadota bacterium]|nr:phosphate acyltransferase [Pseudomonadota bacterium]